MKGVYQHCSERHLHRYLSEFDFRYSNRIRLGIDDVERTERALTARGSLIERLISVKSSTSLLFEVQEKFEKIYAPSWNAPLYEN